MGGRDLQLRKTQACSSTHLVSGGASRPFSYPSSLRVVTTLRALPQNITGETSLSVYLTDAPGDVDSVWVQIDDIVLAGQGAPVSLLEEPTGLINLTELVDVAVALVEGVPVEPGLYTQVRFVLRGAVLLEADGTVYAYGDVVPPAGLEVTGDLTCPSCSQSGIKVRLPGGVELAEGDDAGILMDFDVSQSFGHQAGQSGRWVMHPTILGMVDDAAAIEGGESEGRITGLVSLDLDVEVPMCGGEARDLGAFVPVATATTLIDDEAAALVFTGETDADGEFEIEVLGADTYDLGYEVETDFGAEKLIWTAEVNEAVPTVVEGS